MDDDTDLSGTLIGGRYRLRVPLGRGGMGTVYGGVQEDLGRPVAVKVMRPKAIASRDGLERFRREASATGRLGHPNIVQVTDFGTSDDGGAFLVMELLDGRPLSAVLRDEAPLAPSRVVNLARQVCAALEAAHSAGVVHRDLKPPNVFVVPLGGGQELVKLLDFGVAKLVGEGEWTRLTATGAIVGTPAYMPPEQLIGGVVDARADLFSLGVIMYEALAGRRLFGTLSGIELAAAMLDRTPRPLAELCPDLPPALVALVERAMAKDPAARFQSAAEMASAIDALRMSPAPEPPVPATTATAPAHAPVSSTNAPLSAAPRTGASRTPLAALFALLVVVLAGIGVLIFMRMRSADAPAEANAEPAAQVAAVEPAAPVALEPMPPANGSMPRREAIAASDEPEAEGAAPEMAESGAMMSRHGRRPTPTSPAPSAPMANEPYVFIPEWDVHGAFHNFGDPIQPVRHGIARCLMRRGYVPTEVRADQPLACVELDVSAQGNATATRRVARGRQDATLEDCVKDVVEILQLGPTRTGEPATIDVCFSVRPEL